MKSAKSPIPEGHHTITPSLTVRNAAEAIEFYKKALGAQERMRMEGPDGKIGHAELKIGDSIIFIGEEMPSMGNKFTPNPGRHDWRALPVCAGRGQSLPPRH